MNDITGEMIGNVNVSVYKTDEGYNIFDIHADNEEVLPVLYVIEDTLSCY